MDKVEAVKRAKQELISEYSRLLKVLLESKHLYQRVTVDLGSISDKFRKQIAPQVERDLQYYDTQVANFAKERFAPSLTLLTATHPNFSDLVVATLVVKNIKVFCSVCDCSEVFQPLWFADAANELLKRASSGDFIQLPLKDSFQMIFMVFQCQRCKTDPEGFLVRRNANNLFLEGRSPIEQVTLLPAIPKQESHFLRDAVIAHNAGKTLAAIFYLRTFLEQFARRIVGASGRIAGDDLMDSYGQTLPIAHRDHMPSFKEWYGVLSEALHLASSDSELFQRARLEVERHFEIRRIYNIS
jgi:hypothetical protein